MSKNLSEFLAVYDPDGTRTIADITPVRDADGNSPFAIVRHGTYTAVLALMPMGDHLCIDVHPFADGEDATAGVFGLSDGKRVQFPETGTTSHGWPSANGISVMIGHQAAAPDDGALLREARAWIADCFDDVDVAALSDPDVRQGVALHYEGGWDQFTRDSAGLA